MAVVEEMRRKCACSFELNTYPSKNRGGPIYREECKGCDSDDWGIMERVVRRLEKGELIPYLEEPSDHARGFTPRYVDLSFEVKRMGGIVRVIVSAGGGAWWGWIDYIHVDGVGEAAVVAGDWDWVLELLLDVLAIIKHGVSAICNRMTSEIVPSSGWERIHCSDP